MFNAVVLVVVVAVVKKAGATDRRWCWWWRKHDWPWVVVGLVAVHAVTHEMLDTTVSRRDAILMFIQCIIVLLSWCDKWVVRWWTEQYKFVQCAVCRSRNQTKPLQHYFLSCCFVVLTTATAQSVTSKIFSDGENQSPVADHLSSLSLLEFLDDDGRT